MNDTESDLAFCLARLVQQDPDLRDVVAAWSDLPDVVRVGIVAMIRASARLV